MDEIVTWFYTRTGCSKDFCSLAHFVNAVINHRIIRLPVYQLLYSCVLMCVHFSKCSNYQIASFSLSLCMIDMKHTNDFDLVCIFRFCEMILIQLNAECDLLCLLHCRLWLFIAVLGYHICACVKYYYGTSLVTVCRHLVH